MYKLHPRSLIIILTFVIGIFAVSGWFYYQESQRTQIIVPNAHWELIFFKSINEATTFSGLTELRNISLNEGDIEVRVWTGFGLDPLEGVVLQRIEGIWTAFHIKIDDSYETKKASVKRLNRPKSGWEAFWKEIVDKEILTLPDSSDINCGSGGIDGGSYVVEINQNKVYRTYRLSESYSDGKCREADQMEEIGDIIGDEFDSGNEECQRAEWFACTKARKSNKEKNQ